MIKIGIPSKGRLRKDTLNIFKSKKLKINKINKENRENQCTNIQFEQDQPAYDDAANFMAQLDDSPTAHFAADGDGLKPKQLRKSWASRNNAEGRRSLEQQIA